jgi:hypothetical protein
MRLGSAQIQDAYKAMLHVWVWGAQRYPVLLGGAPLGLDLFLDLVLLGLLLAHALLLQLHQLHLPHPLLLMLRLRTLPRQLILIPASQANKSLIAPIREGWKQSDLVLKQYFMTSSVLPAQ